MKARIDNATRVSGSSEEMDEPPGSDPQRKRLLGAHPPPEAAAPTHVGILHRIDLQWSFTGTSPANGAHPPNELLVEWARAALRHVETACEVCIRIVDQPDIQELNRTYRQQDRPTNVLAFPAGYDDEDGMHVLGDIVICSHIVEQEARDQHKTPEAHWAHMIVHGCLHLQGFDHITEADRLKMEALELRILHELGFEDPYNPPDGTG